MNEKITPRVSDVLQDMSYKSERVLVVVSYVGLSTVKTIRFSNGYLWSQPAEWKKEHFFLREWKKVSIDRVPKRLREESIRLRPPPGQPWIGTEFQCAALVNPTGKRARQCRRKGTAPKSSEVHYCRIHSHLAQPKARQEKQAKRGTPQRPSCYLTVDDIRKLTQGVPGNTHVWLKLKNTNGTFIAYRAESVESFPNAMLKEGSIAVVSRKFRKFQML